MVFDSSNDFLSGDIAFNSSIQTNEEGLYNIDFTIDNVNGQVDEDNSNNTQSFSVEVIGDIGKTYVPDNNFEQALIFFGYDDILDDSVNTNQIKFVENLNLISWISDSISDLTELKTLKTLGLKSL